MANNLGSLVVSLGLDAAEFTRGLSKSEYQTQQWVRRFETGIEAARTGAFAAFAAMGTAAAVLNKQLEDIAGFNDLADKMGDTAEAVASLKLAADLSGTSLDTMASASVKLTSALAKTDDESKGVGAALKAIGLEMESFKQLSPTAQIEAVAQAMAGFEDGAGKTAVAVQLFGKSGADLIPMLNDLAETGGRQVTLTGQQIAAADEYSKSMARLRSEVQTLVQVTAAEAAPVMTQIVKLMRDTVQYSTSAAGGVDLLGGSLLGAKVALESVLVVGSQVASNFREIGDFAGAYAAVSVALVKGDVAGAKAIGAAYRELSDQRLKALEDYQSKVLGGQSGFWRMPSLGTATAQASYSNEGRNYTPTPPRINTTGFAVPSSQDNKAARLLEDQKRAQQEYEAWMRSLTDAENEYRLNKLDERIAAQKKEEKDYADWLASLEQATIEGGAANHIKRLDEQREAMEKTKDFAKEMGLTFTSAFEDAIVGGKKLSDVLKGLEQDLLRIVIRKSITEPLGDLITSALPSLFGGGKAIGGAVAGGTSYLVGERGPELFTPATAGSITPSGGMGVVVNVINQSGQQLQARQSTRTGADGAQVVDLILSAVADGLANRSGPVARGLEAGYGLRPSMA